jgi:hypothetical protein
MATTALVAPTSPQGRRSAEGGLVRSSCSSYPSSHADEHVLAQKLAVEPADIEALAGR